MKFSELTLQTKKTIYTSAIIFFFLGDIILTFLIPKNLWYRDFKYLMLIALVVFAKKLRGVRNIEKGLPEDYRSPAQKRLRIVVFIILGFAIVAGGIIS